MRRDIWHLHPVDVIVPANHMIKSVLPMHRNKWHSIIIVKQESAISIYGLLHFRCISVLNDYDRNLRPSRRRGICQMVDMLGDGFISISHLVLTGKGIGNL